MKSEKADEVVLLFDKSDFKRLVQHTKSASSYSKFYTMEDNQPGLILAGDHGVYLISNGQPVLLASGELAEKASRKSPLFCAYARGCDPRTNEFEAWWATHNAVDDGNDFCIFIPIEDAEEALSIDEGDIRLIVTPEEVSFRLK